MSDDLQKERLLLTARPVQIMTPEEAGRVERADDFSSFRDQIEVAMSDYLRGNRSVVFAENDGNALPIAANLRLVDSQLREGVIEDKGDLKRFRNTCLSFLSRPEQMRLSLRVVMVLLKDIASQDFTEEWGLTNMSQELEDFSLKTLSERLGGSRKIKSDDYKDIVQFVRDVLVISGDPNNRLSGENGFINPGEQKFIIGAVTLPNSFREKLLNLLDDDDKKAASAAMWGDIGELAEEFNSREK